MFKVNEIKSWAKRHGITLKKKGEGYVWFEEGFDESAPSSIDDAVFAIYNKITGGKYVGHQKKYRSGDA